MSGSHCAMFPFVLEKLLNALSDWMEMVRVLPQFLSDATYHYHASPWGWFCQSEVQCSRPKGSILVLSDHRIIHFLSHQHTGFLVFGVSYGCAVNTFSNLSCGSLQLLLVASITGAILTSSLTCNCAKSFPFLIMNLMMLCEMFKIWDIFFITKP